MERKHGVKIRRDVLNEFWETGVHWRKEVTGGPWSMQKDDRRRNGDGGTRNGNRGITQHGKGE